MRIGLGLGLTRRGGVRLPDFYVDSVGGSDSNAGTIAAPLQTLAGVSAAIAASGNTRKYIALKCGSTWREELDLSALSDVRIESYGTGTPPIVTGFDITTGWTDDTATVAGRWYKDVAHNGEGSLRQVVIDNGELLLRVASAAAVSTAGTYYSADCGTAGTIRVYINTATNPNTNGHTYEVTTRRIGVSVGADATITGIAARGALSNNGALETGKGATVTKCVAAYGTKHNALIASGTATDVVFYDTDAPSVSEASTLPLVVFAADLAGETFTGTRLLFCMRHSFSGLTFSHTLNDPTDQIDSITFDQCVGYIPAGGGSGFGGGANSYNIANSSVWGAGAGAAVGVFASALTVTRCLFSQASDADNYTASGPSTWSQTAIYSSVSGGGKALIGATAGQNLSISYCSLVAHPDNYANAVNWVSGSGGALTVNRSIVQANNALNIPAGSTYGPSNNNVFGLANIGPFGTNPTTFRNLNTNMADWRTDTGDDANSVGLAVSAFSGTPANGDFTPSATALAAVAIVGVQEHWNFNTRAVVAGPPTAFPMIPVSFAEALTYIADPEAWDFYP